MTAVASLSVTAAGVVADSPAMFPAAVRTDEWIVVAYSTVADGWPGSEVRVTRSPDDGITWTRPVTVAAASGDEVAVNGAIGLARLADGTLLLPYNGVRWTPGMGTEGRRLSLRLARSRDDGISFETGEPIDVGFFWPAVYGQIIELDGGEVLWPIWGRQLESEKWRSVVLSSDDAGVTWRLKSTIAYDPDARLIGEYVETGDLGAEGSVTEEETSDPSFRPHDPTDGFSETSVCQLEDGRLLAILRQQGVDGDQSLLFFRAYSADRGETWSHYEPLPFTGMSPALWRLPDGALLLASRRCAPDGSGIPAGVEARLGSPDGAEWGEPISLRDAHGVDPQSEYQCGYPAIVSGATRDSAIVVFYSYVPNVGRYLAWNALEPADSTQ
jgi:hypothetical protein